MPNKTTAWVIFKAVNKFTAPVRAMSRGVGKMFKNIRKQVKYARRELKVFDRQLTTMTSGLMRRMPGIGMLSGAGLVYGAKEAIESHARLESMETAIRYVSGSAEEGQKNLDFLRKTTIDLGIDVEQAAEGFKRLLASSKSVESMDTIRKNFEGIGIAARVMGLDAQSQGRVIWALSEMYSKGTVMAQELKIQLGNALPGAFELMAKTAGLSTSQLIKVMEKGGLRSKEIVTKFIGALRDEYAGGMEFAKKTTSFALAQISISWKYTLADIGNMLSDTGILDHILTIAHAISKWVKANEKLIGLNIKKGLDQIISFGKWVLDNRATIISAFKGIVTSIILFKATMAAMSIASFLTNPVGLAVTAILLLGAAFMMARDNYFTMKDDIMSGQKIFIKQFEQDAAIMGSIFEGIWDLDVNKILGGMEIMLIKMQRMFKKMAVMWHSINPMDREGKKNMAAKAFAEESALGVKQAQIMKQMADGTYAYGSGGSDSKTGSNLKESLSPSQIDLVDRSSKYMDSALASAGVDKQYMNINLTNQTGTPMEANVADTSGSAGIQLTDANGNVIR